MENIIYNELIYRGYNVDVGVVEIRVDENGKRTKKQLEVDFVVNQGSKRYYIQSAFALVQSSRRWKIISPICSIVVKPWPKNCI